MFEYVIYFVVVYEYVHRESTPWSPTIIPPPIKIVDFCSTNLTLETVFLPLVVFFLFSSDHLGQLVPWTRETQYCLFAQPVSEHILGGPNSSNQIN